VVLNFRIREPQKRKESVGVTSGRSAPADDRLPQRPDVREHHKPHPKSKDKLSILSTVLEAWASDGSSVGRSSNASDGEQGVERTSNRQPKAGAIRNVHMSKVDGLLFKRWLKEGPKPTATEEVWERRSPESHHE